MNDDERAFRAQYPDRYKDVEADDVVERLRDLEADQEYEVYRAVFEQMPALDLVESVPRSHHAIYLAFLGELQSARSMLYDPSHENARITGYIRGYRAVDAYARALSDGIVHAFAAPYANMFVGGLKARAFDEAFGGNAVRLAMKRFFDRHHEMRNEVAHGLRVPTHDELRAMLVDAKTVHDLADAAVNPVATHPLDLLEPEDYPHDDHRPAVVVNPPPRPA